MKVPTNRIKDVVNHYINEISSIYGMPEANQLILMLTEHYFGIDRIKLAVDPDFRLSESELLTIHFAVKELKQHKPVQYITGFTEFYNRRFDVSNAVLIPRPETEQLLQNAIDFAKTQTTIKSILDVGTGSGCIAVSLALEMPEVVISSCDISVDALSMAAENAKQLGAKVNFFTHDILNDAHNATLPVWDMIVSNPPYVTESDKLRMRQNVIGWEPHLALFVTNNDPLIFYKALLRFGTDHLSSGGCIWVEINELFGPQLVELFQRNHYANVNLHHDFHGKPRFISAIKN